MANLAITNTFTAGTKILAAEVNTNNTDISTYINDRNQASADWDFVSSAGLITAKALLRTNDGTAAATAMSFTSEVGMGAYRISSNILGFATGGTERLRLTTAVTQMAGNLNVPNGTTAAPSMTFTNDSDTGFSTDGTNSLQMSTGGSERARLNSAGGLLILDDPAGTPGGSTLYKGNIVKGWINFDGTGTIAINDSFNVSSIVDDGTGTYTINWDLDFANANYSVIGMALFNHTVSIGNDGGDRAVGSVHVHTTTAAGALVDNADINVIAIGDQ